MTQMETLNSSQTEAVRSMAPLNVIIGTPGCGKTKVLVARIRHLIESGVHPSDIVAITYTHAAASEIQKRIVDGWECIKAVTTDGKPHPSGDAWFPPHSIRAYTTPPQLGYCGTIHGYVLKLLQQHGPRLLKLPSRLSVIDEESAETLLQEVIKDLGYKGTKAELEEELREHPSIGSTLKPVLSSVQLVNVEYHHRMIQYGILSFDAILDLGNVLVERLEPNVSAHLLIDEYQDASDRVHRICDGLPIANKFVVADPDQAIMSFMGGKVSNVMSLTRNPSWCILKLEDNYRCDRSICEAAQSLIEHNKNRMPKVTRSATSGEGQVDVWTNLPTEMHEYTAIAHELLKLPQGCTAAVLARTNFVAAQVARTLESIGITVQKKDKLGLPEDWSICRKFIALLANPENDYLAYQLLLRGGKNMADNVRLRAAENMESINAYAFKLPKQTAPDEVIDVLGRIGIEAESVERVQRAIDMLNENDGLPELCLVLGNEDLHRKETGSGVTVSTIHSFKGREADWVILAGCDLEVFPGNDNIEEARRLFYVGMTRARHRLILSTANTRRQHGWHKLPQPAMPSQFLKEILN